MCISEVHGGAGLGCGPASAHYIAEQVLGYGFLRWFENKLYHATLTTYPKVCQLLLLSLGLFVKRSLNSGVEICKMYNAMRVLSHTQLNTTKCPFCFCFCSKHRRPLFKVSTPLLECQVTCFKKDGRNLEQVLKLALKGLGLA